MTSNYVKQEGKRKAFVFPLIPIMYSHWENQWVATAMILSMGQDTYPMFRIVAVPVAGDVLRLVVAVEILSGKNVG